jgi:SAM-dependent methyltransferase
MITERKELFGKDYFDRNYTDYAIHNPPRKLLFYRALVEHVMQGIDCPRILEIGCAFGLFLSVLDPTWRRYGLDTSTYAIQQARAKLSDVRLTIAAAPHIPFVEVFDVIVSFDVIEHVPDLEQVAMTIYSKLTAGGYFIFVVPVYDGPTAPLIRMLDKDQTHIHKTSRYFWLHWAQLRFSVVEWWGIYRYLSPGGYYLHIPTRWLRHYAPAIAVVTRKGVL